MNKDKDIDPEIRRVVFDDLYIRSTLWAFLVASVFVLIAFAMNRIIKDVIYPSIEKKQVSEWRLY